MRLMNGMHLERQDVINDLAAIKVILSGVAVEPADKGNEEDAIFVSGESASRSASSGDETCDFERDCIDQRAW